MFTPLPHRDYEVHKHTFIWIHIQILHLIYTSSLTDLFFNPLPPCVPFLYPLKTSGNLGFHGVSKCTPASNRLKNLSRRKTVYIKVFLNRFMLILIIHNKNSSFLFLWRLIIIVITAFIKNILKYWYFSYYMKSLGTFTLTFILFCIYIIHIHTISKFLHVYSLLSHWAVTFHFAKSFLHTMSCHLQLNFLPHITKRWWCFKFRLIKKEKRYHLLKADYPWQYPNPCCSKLLAFK